MVRLGRRGRAWRAALLPDPVADISGGIRQHPERRQSHPYGMARFRRRLWSGLAGGTLSHGSAGPRPHASEAGAEVEPPPDANMAAMDLWQPGAKRVSRRRLLLAAGGASAMLAVAAPELHAASGKGETLPADWGRYADPSTEFEILRLTRPSYASYLSAPPGRCVARRGEFAVLASDRSDSLQLQRLDLKSGQSRVLTAAERLHPSAFALSV